MIEIEIRSSKSGDDWELEGLATTWNKLYKVTEADHTFNERFKAGAFDAAVRGEQRYPPQLRLEHMQDGPPLAGCGPSGTMRVSNVEEGLHVWASGSKSDPDWQRLIPKVQSHLIRSMSVAFYGPEDEWSADGSERTIRSAGLAEVSLVTTPANTGAIVTAVRRGQAGENIEVRTFATDVTYVDQRPENRSDVLLPARYDEFLLELRRLQQPLGPVSRARLRPRAHHTPQMRAIMLRSVELERRARELVARYG